MCVCVSFARLEFSGTPREKRATSTLVCQETKRTARTFLLGVSVFDAEVLLLALVKGKGFGPFVLHLALALAPRERVLFFLILLFASKGKTEQQERYSGVLLF